MGDTRVFDEVKESGQSPQADETGSRLRDDALAGMRQAGSDKGVESGQGGDAAGKANNPYDHIGNAGQLIKAIESLADKKAEDKVTISDTPGMMREVTVKELRDELLKKVEKELESAIKAADSLPQDRVTSSLWETRTQMSNAKGLAELDQLSRREAILESMKHAPSVTRFMMAEFQVQKGDLVQAKAYLDQIAKIDREAALDPAYKELVRAVDGATRGDGGELAAEKDPFTAMARASEKVNKGDLEGAKKEFENAIALAGNMDPQLVKQQLAQIEAAKKEHAGNPEMLKQLTAMELAWGHTKAVVQMNYAEFLVGTGQKEEAKKVLAEIEKNDPAIVEAAKEEFDKLKRVSNEEDKPFENPFVHLSEFQKAYEKGDLSTAKTELLKAKEAADTIDREEMARQKKACIEALEKETDPEKRKQIEQLRDQFDAFEHSAAMMRTMLATFELAGKDYNSARQYLQDAKDLDPEFCARAEVKFDELWKGSEEPSTWEKVKGWAKDFAKELVCDAAAILAGVGAAVLTGWSGPAAVGVGAVAGAATYTAMKTLVFGEEFHWSMPLWGALDGASGGMAALAYKGLTTTAGKIVTKEVAENAVLKTGGQLAVMEGTAAGFEMGKVAQIAAKEGLAAMGKDVGFWGRQVSRIPFLGAAMHPEYVAAKSAVNALGRRMLLANVVRDVGTAGTMSLVYRGGHEGYKLATGEHDLGSFAAAYGKGVLSDSVMGAFAGPIGRWAGEGLSSVSGRVASHTFPELGTKIGIISTAAAPSAHEAYNAYEFLTKKVEPTYQYHQVPLDLQKNKREFSQRFNNLQTVLSGDSQYTVEDALQPQVDGSGKVVTPDEGLTFDDIFSTEKEKEK